MGSIISKWVWPGIITVVVGTIATLMFTQSTIEEDLTQKSLTTMSNVGDHSAPDWADITFDGRDGTISGISTDPDAADALVAQVSTLHGVRSVISDITLAPTASPYPFKAVLSDGTVALSGGVPSIGMRDALLEQTGATDAGLELMSGVPDGDWLAATGFAVSQLDGLENGEASLADLSLSVQGLAKSHDAYASTTTDLMAQLPNGLTLASATIEPAFVENYSFTASRAAGETMVSGFIPDEATRVKIGELSGASTDNLQLASGAPASYASSLDFGLGMLNHMSSGEMNLDSADLSVSGTAASSSDHTAIATLLSSGAPEGVDIDSQIMQAIAVPYTWSAEKFANGKLVLSGNAPDEVTREAILTRAGDAAVDNMQLAAGAPEHFYEDALVGISALSILETGRTGHSTDGWFLNGQPKTVAAGNASANALMTARTRPSDWNTVLADAPDMLPYTWSAEKFANGSLVLFGNVPNPATRTALLTRAGASAIDRMQVSNGAPTNFYEDSLVAVSALADLETGRSGISASGWFLIGHPTTDAASASASGALITARTNASNWHINLDDVPPVPVVPFTWSSQKDTNGQLTIIGHVPDEATRTAILARAGEGAIDLMQVDLGAPEHFYEDALVAVSALSELQSGRSGLAGGGWYLAGQPATEEASAAASGALMTARTNASNWSVSIADAPLMPVIPYTWSTQKYSDGTLVITGNVPDEATQSAILTRAGEGAIDRMQISYGAPENFYEDALVAVSALNSLATGRSGHSARGWFLLGLPTSFEARDAATSALITARTPAANWNVNLADVLMADITFIAELSEENGIALSGSVPDTQTRNYLGTVAGGVSTLNLVEVPGVPPENFTLNARTGIHALRRLIDGRLAYENQTWSLTGSATDTDTRNDALAQINTLQNAADWETSISVPTAAAICQTQVELFIAKFSIEFESGSAQIASTSMPLVQDLAGFLNQCPASAVHVEGHTDSQGGFADNLKLSTDRAEAIVIALTKLGISSERLYSIGYGESQPIDTNDTPQGRQTNRRIVFKIIE